MKFVRWFISVAFLAMAMTSSGQRASNWRDYKAADGLPETSVSSVTLGPHGHLWVRSPNVGWIGWLDGYDVKAIPAPSLGNNRIYESSSGQLWAFSNDELLEYSRQSRGWVRYPLPEISAMLRKNNLSQFRQLPLCPTKQNHVLLLLPDEIIEYNTENAAQPQTSVFRAARQTGLQKFLSLLPARDGGLWVTGARGLARLTGPARNLKADSPWQEYLVEDQLQIHNLREPTEDDDGGVTMLAESTRDGKQMLAHFDGQHWTVRDGLGEKIIQAWRETDKTWWAATYTALFKGKDDKPFSAADTDTATRRYFDVATETNGVFWLATSDGLLRYAPRIWQIPAGAPDVDSSTYSMTEDTAGRLWICTAQALFLCQSNVWTHYSLPPETTGDSTERHTLFNLANGTIAFVANGHFLQFDPQTTRFTPVVEQSQTQLKPLGFLQSGILCVQSTSLAVSNQSPQLEIFDGAKFSPFPHPQPEADATRDFLFLYTAQNGDIWLSSNNGFVRYNGKKWQSFSVSSQVGADAPRCMIELNDGKIWCGVQDLILQFDGATWTAIHGGFYHVNSLLKAHDGSIWIASENGLHRFYHGAWVGNSVEDGLPAGSTRQIYEDQHGHVWAATPRGLALYHPEADPDPPQTSVQNLAEPNNTIREGSIVTVSFNGMDKWKYTAEDRLLYSYQLDGQDWSPYQEQRNASFLDLSPGKHSFHVRSMDRNWNVSPTPAALVFTIDLPWYRETRLVLISSAGLAIVLFFASLALNRHRQLLRSYAEVEAKVALRTKQLDLANRELFHSQKMNALGTLAAGIAHDFNNILSIIKGSTQIIEDNLDNRDKIRTRADRIKTVVEQGSGIVRAMLGFSRISDRQLTACDVNAIVRETITLLGDRFSREIEVKFIPSATPLPPVPASKDFIQQILLNFIFNAADAMTGVHQIILTTAQSSQLPTSLALKPVEASDYVLLAVKDFGSGIAPEIMPRIFEPFFTTKSMSARRGTGLGLSMVYELARQMDAGLSVTSAIGQGSVFTLIIPVRDLPLETVEKTGK